MPLTTKVEYEKAIGVVKSVISDWDPYSLLHSGAPSDEFDNEIATVVSKIPSMKTHEEAAQAISQVFSAAFGSGDFAPADCLGIAGVLMDRLSEEGLL